MSVSLLAVTVDCADAGKLAGFWSQVLERAIDPEPTAEFASIGLQDGGAPGATWMFHAVPEGKVAKNRIHIDFVTPDLSSEVERILTLGATHLADVEEGGYRWSTLADPEGNEFDVVAAPS
jgi:predicted enzyme related to lactoylglutathione lyase